MDMLILKLLLGVRLIINHTLEVKHYVSYIVRLAVSNWEENWHDVPRIKHVIQNLSELHHDKNRKVNKLNSMQLFVAMGCCSVIVQI